MGDGVRFFVTFLGVCVGGGGRRGGGLDKNSCETGRVVTYVVSFDNVQLQLVKGFYFEMVKCKKKKKKNEH